MERGDNFQDYVPSEPTTYLPTIDDVKNHHNIGGYGLHFTDGINIEL